MDKTTARTGPASLQRPVFFGVRGLMGLTAALVVTSACAQPFPNGKAEVGKPLHDKTCVACHNSMMPGGKGADLYSEDFRKVNSVAGLQGMVEMCATRTRSGWFPEEIEHVSRYLNDSYYRFLK